MIMIQPYRFLFHPVFWGMIFVCFTVIGGYEAFNSLHAPAAEGTGPYGSSNGLLREFLGLHQGAEKILESCKTIPVAQPSFVFYPAINANSVLSLQMIAYLAWPRRVAGLGIHQHNLEPVVEQLRAQFNAAIWLYGLAPSPNLKNRIVVDRGLLFIPTESAP